MSFRDVAIDDLKSKFERKRIIAESRCCTMPGCDELITFFKGPGHDLYCREHQVAQVQYGGYGRTGRVAGRGFQ